MERQENAAPIVIKRKKRGGDAGHHGGAWKIAFADFMTAMMAFFIVMWLVNATTESQRKGLADYFSPTVPISPLSGGGDGLFGGRLVDGDATLARAGAEVTALAPPVEEPTAGADTPEDGDSAEAVDPLEALAAELQGRGGESMITEQMLRHVVTRLTDEGLIVEIFDLPDQPVFAGDTDSPLPVLVALAGLVAEVFGKVGNGVTVEGHLRRLPVVLADNPAWDLSTARAHRMRALLEGEGLPSARMRRITGHADRQPVTRDAAAVRNNRLEVILLRDRS